MATAHQIRDPIAQTTTGTARPRYRRGSSLGVGARPESSAKDLELSYVKAPKLDRKAVRYVSDHFARE